MLDWEKQQAISDETEGLQGRDTFCLHLSLSPSRLWAAFQNPIPQTQVLEYLFPQTVK